MPWVASLLCGRAGLEHVAMDVLTWHASWTSDSICQVKASGAWSQGAHISGEDTGLCDPGKMGK